MSSRRDRYRNFLFRSYARMLDRLARVTEAIAEGGADAKTLARLWRAGERLAESLTHVVEMPEQQRHHRKSPKGTRDD